MSDVQHHKMLRSRQPSFLIGEDSLMKEVMSHAIQNFRDALQPAKHWSLPQKNAADAKKAWLEAALEDGTAIPDLAPVKK